jgi:hypothetical protein
MASSSGTLQLKAAGHSSNEQAMTDCAFVNPADFAQLCAAARVEPTAAIEKGLLCAVNEAVLLTKCVGAETWRRGRGGGGFVVGT